MVTRRMFFGVIAALAAPLQPVKQWTYVKLRFNSVYGKAKGRRIIAYADTDGNFRYYGAESDASRILRKMGLAKNPPHV